MLTPSRLSPQAIFDAIADPTRRRMLALITRQGELCVCELTAALAEAQPKISRHLGVLRNAGLLSSRREGTWVHYRLAAALPPWTAPLLASLDEASVAELDDDLSRLGQMQNKQERCTA